MNRADSRGEKSVPLLITLVKFPRASIYVKKEVSKEIRSHSYPQYRDRQSSYDSIGRKNRRTILGTFDDARATRLLFLKFFNEPLEKGTMERTMVVRVDP